MFGRKSKKIGFEGKRVYSVDEYLEIEAQTAETYEFWYGDDALVEDEIVGTIQKLNSEERISPPRKTIQKIENANYTVFSNFSSKKKKVWIESEKCFFYPDLFVAGDKIDYYPNRKDIISNPSIILEYSTRGENSNLIDRTQKFWIYQKIPSLREYVLISENGKTVVETYNRIDNKNWKYQIFSEDENDLVTFESINVKIPIKNIYL